VKRRSQQKVMKSTKRRRRRERVKEKEMKRQRWRDRDDEKEINRRRWEEMMSLKRGSWRTVGTRIDLGPIIILGAKNLAKKTLAHTRANTIIDACSPSWLHINMRQLSFKHTHLALEDNINTKEE
jgi:hypothetical protein